MGIVVTIAGSDPSGGAGVQADLRAIEALGCQGASAATVVTAQNGAEVTGAWPVCADGLSAQLESISSSVTIDAVKIGLLGSPDQADVIAAWLRRVMPCRGVVLDPVLASSGGHRFAAGDMPKAIRALLPLSTLVTPNIPEARTLAGLGPDASLADAAAVLLALGAANVMITGGHGPGGDILVDRLYSAAGAWDIHGPRVLTPHTHGTGCLYSTAAACALAQGASPLDACTAAGRAVRSALASARSYGSGRGHPLLGSQSSVPPTQAHRERLDRLNGLYVITSDTCALSHLEVAKAAIDGGAQIVQLRSKVLSLRDMVNTAKAMRAECARRGVLFVVNDRADVALAARADGLHIGPDDLDPADARGLIGPDMLLGVSVASLAEADAWMEHASYFGVGAIFGTQSKADAGEPVGVGQIERFRATYPCVPLVAIGGIDLTNIESVARAGAASAAVISAVTRAGDPRAAASELQRRFRDASDQ